MEVVDSQQAPKDTVALLDEQQNSKAGNHGRYSVTSSLHVNFTPAPNHLSEHKHWKANPCHEPQVGNAEADDSTLTNDTSLVKDQNHGQPLCNKILIRQKPDQISSTGKPICHRDVGVQHGGGSGAVYFQSSQLSTGPEQHLDQPGLIHTSDQKLQSQLRELQNQHHGLEAEQQQVQTQHNQLQNQHSQLQNQHNQLQSEHSQLQNQHNQLQNQTQKLMDQNQILEEYSKVLQQCNALHQQQHQKTQEELAGYQRHFQVVEKERQRLSQEQEAVVGLQKREQYYLKQENDQLRVQLEHKSEALKLLGQDLESSQNVVAKYKQQVQQLTAALDQPLREKIWGFRSTSEYSWQDDKIVQQLQDLDRSLDALVQGAVQWVLEGSDPGQTDSAPPADNDATHMGGTRNGWAVVKQAVVKRQRGGDISSRSKEAKGMQSTSDGSGSGRLSHKTKTDVISSWCPVLLAGQPPARPPQLQLFADLAKADAQLQPLQRRFLEALLRDKMMDCLDAKVWCHMMNGLPQISWPHVYGSQATHSSVVAATPSTNTSTGHNNRNAIGQPVEASWAKGLDAVKGGDGVDARFQGIQDQNTGLDFQALLQQPKDGDDAEMVEACLHFYRRNARALVKLVGEIDLGSIPLPAGSAGSTGSAGSAARHGLGQVHNVVGSGQKDVSTVMSYKLEAPAQDMEVDEPVAQGGNRGEGCVVEGMKRWCQGVAFEILYFALGCGSGARPSRILCDSGSSAACNSRGSSIRSHAQENGLCSKSFGISKQVSSVGSGDGRVGYDPMDEQERGGSSGSGREHLNGDSGGISGSGSGTNGGYGSKDLGDLWQLALRVAVDAILLQLVSTAVHPELVVTAIERGSVYDPSLACKHRAVNLHSTLMWRSRPEAGVLSLVHPGTVILRLLPVVRYVNSGDVVAQGKVCVTGEGEKRGWDFFKGAVPVPQNPGLT